MGSELTLVTFHEQNSSLNTSFSGPSCCFTPKNDHDFGASKRDIQNQRLIVLPRPSELLLIPKHRHAPQHRPTDHVLCRAALPDLQSDRFPPMAPQTALRAAARGPGRHLTARGGFRRHRTALSCRTLDPGHGGDCQTGRGPLHHHHLRRHHHHLVYQRRSLAVGGVPPPVPQRRVPAQNDGRHRGLVGLGVDLDGAGAGDLPRGHRGVLSPAVYRQLSHQRSHRPARDFFRHLVGRLFPSADSVHFPSANSHDCRGDKTAADRDAAPGRRAGWAGRGERGSAGATPLEAGQHGDENYVGKFAGQYDRGVWHSAGQNSLLVSAHSRAEQGHSRGPDQTAKLPLHRVLPLHTLRLSHLFSTVPCSDQEATGQGTRLAARASAHCSSFSTLRVDLVEVWFHRAEPPASCHFSPQLTQSTGPFILGR